MSHFDLCCFACGAAHAADMYALSCERCGGPLDVRYTAPPDRDAGDGPPMPYHDPAAAVTLGEGGTPCVELRSVAVLLGVRRVYGKAEYQNPTGSFKDRGTAAMVSVAAELGVTAMVEDSSGNAGASLAAYAARGAHRGARVRAGGRARGQAEPDPRLRRPCAPDRGAAPGGGGRGRRILRGAGDGLRLAQPQPVLSGRHQDVRLRGGAPAGRRPAPAPGGAGGQTGRWRTGPWKGLQRTG